MTKGRYEARFRVKVCVFFPLSYKELMTRVSNMEFASTRGENSHFEPQPMSRSSLGLTQNTSYRERDDHQDAKHASRPKQHL